MIFSPFNNSFTRLFQPTGVLTMLKKILTLVALLYAAVCFAAVDVNKATAAELDGIKGIGPAISAKIVDERAKGQFKDWNDFIVRVKGVGEVNAAKFSAEGLTVGGAGYKGVTATAAASKKEDKPVPKAEEKKAETKPAAAKEAAKDMKASDCAAKAIDKTGKPLAGAAKSAFVKKCEADTKAGAAAGPNCEAKAIGSNGKPLAGAAKTAYIKKCEADAKAGK
jgi:competence protein ComEA